MEHFTDIQDTAFEASLSKVVVGNFAVIQFDMDSQITWANDNFLAAMGYRKEELLHKKHRIFMPPEAADTDEYRKFWDDLRSDKAFNGHVKRVTKSGQTLWLDACYAPLKDANNVQTGVVKVAIDTTSRVLARNALDHALTRLSDHDLTVQIGEWVDDDFEPVRTKFNDTIHALHTLVTTIQQSSAQISTLSEQSSQQSGALSHSCLNILQDVDDSIENLGVFSEAFSNVQNEAKIAQAVVDTVAKSSSNGSKVVNGAIESIRSVNAMMERVSEVTDVIQGFARQTNLLGINAAVEAARAGEAGAGFSVVAAEVRALSEQSSAASRQISDLIKDSRSEVAKGVEHVDAAGTALKEIGLSVSDAVKAIGEISEAVSSQFSTVQSIQERLQGIQVSTQSVQQSAETTVQTSSEVVAETHEMSKQAGNFIL